MNDEVNIVYIDDVKSDRRILELQMENAVLRRVRFVTLAKPPSDLRELLKYDGVLLDYSLQGHSETGFDIARKLHKLDVWLLTALLTGTQAEILPNDVLHFVDRVIWKENRHDHFQDICNLSSSMRAFVKNITRSVRYQRRVGLIK